MPVKWTWGRVLVVREWWTVDGLGGVSERKEVAIVNVKI
jgi:hypothetical protein